MTAQRVRTPSGSEGRFAGGTCEARMRCRGLAPRFRSGFGLGRGGWHLRGAGRTLAGMRESVAYLITWRTYGTWLHGDARGSVDREHNTPGTPLLAPDAGRAARSAGRMTQGAVELDRRGREIVAGAVREHCQHLRDGSCSRWPYSRTTCIRLSRPARRDQSACWVRSKRGRRGGCVRTVGHGRRHTCGHITAALAICGTAGALKPQRHM